MENRAAGSVEIQQRASLPVRHEPNNADSKERDEPFRGNGN